MRRKGWKLGAVFVAWLLATPVAAGPLRLPFQLDSRHSAILIEAEVNGKPATLIVDTGAAQTILDATSADVSNLDLKISRFANSAPGLRGEAVWAEARLKLGDRTWRQHRVAAMNLTALASRYGRPIHGILGQDILRQFARVTIDFRKRVLILADAPHDEAEM